VIIKKSLSYLLARGVPGLINLLAISTYTRLLTPEIYGQYSFSLAFIMLSMTICFQWLQFGLIRYYHKKNVAGNVLLSNILFAFVLLAITLLPVFLSIIQLIQPDFTFSMLSFIFVLAMMMSAFNINLQIPVANGASLSYGMLSAAKAVLGLSFGAFFITLGYGLNGLFVALIIASLLPIIWSIPRFWTKVSWQLIDRKLLKSLFIYGLPLSSTLMMNMMINNSDRIMLSWLKGNEYTGLYSAVYDLTNFSLVIMVMSVNLALYPLIIKAYENNNQEKTQDLLGKNTIALVLISLPLLLVFLCIPQQLADLLLGQKFRETGAAVMPVIGIATFIWGIKAYYFDLSFLITRKTTPLFIISIIGMLSNILLNYILIPRYGINGAAYATLITSITVLCLTMIWSRKVYPLPIPIAELSKTIIMAISIGLFIWLIRHYYNTQLITNSFTVILLYTLGVYSFNFLDFRPQLRQFLSALRDV